MDQIELPGDVWNNNSVFKNNLFSNVLDLESIPKTWNMPQIIRDIYNQLKNAKDIDGFYPEQFDITFDFVPRMCSARACHICPFGKNGADLTCIPTKDKYCPVALVSCGYVSKCTWEGSESWEGSKDLEGWEDCIIREGISRGICRAGLR